MAKQILLRATALVKGKEKYLLKLKKKQLQQVFFLQPTPSVLFFVIIDFLIYV
jgi:hypothetical protein